MHTTLWFGRRHTTASAGASLALQRIQTRQQRHRSVKDAPHLRNRIATNRDVVSPELAGISGKIRYRPSKRQFAFTLGKMVRRLDRWNLWKAFAVSQSQTRLRIASSSTSRVTSPTPPDQKSIDLRRSFVRACSCVELERRKSVPHDQHLQGSSTSSCEEYQVPPATCEPT